jgi:hypothetical protein
MHRLAYLNIAIAFLSCSLSANEAIAQEEGAIHSADTVHAVDTARMPEDSGFHMSKSALEAVLLSTALPGAGQVYLGQAWKLPIIYGLIGAFGYGVYIQNSRYHSTLHSIDSLNARLDVPDSNIALEYRSSRDFYLNDRDKWWIYLALTYIADILDAYIAANLYDFDVSDPSPSPSSFNSYYDPVDKSVGLSFTIKF